MPLHSIKDQNRIPTNELAFYAPLWKRDGQLLISDDAMGYRLTPSGTIWTPQGRIFDGLTSNIDTGGVINLTSTGTIAVWAYPTSSSNATLLATNNWSTDRNGYILVGNSSLKTLQLEIADGVGNLITTGNSLSYPTGSWGFFVGTWDGSFLSTFTNGQLSCTPLAQTRNAVNITNTKIGVDASGLYFFGGLIGEAILFSRALSAIEIQQLYLQTKWRYK